ncbi:Hypothetical protein ZAZAV_475 [Cedratvirus Zaza IHUMI]|uniref:Endonuclease n=1 Tax=Cedratvirus Zaza IHUMI TaxID=2126979 RepID=A0A2R8FFQ1_9VIRU|nr:Hypothetical protein ZAZAV_475 [Cedratvirus Zaza IHUMI]
MSYGRCILCKKKGNFGLPEKKERYCKDHRIPGTTDLVHRKCLECNKIPFFGYPGEKKGIYCKEHKLEGMQYNGGRRCSHPDCNTSATFGHPRTKKVLYCKAHKEDGMTCNVFPTCLICGVRARYNYLGEKKGVYCIEHKLESMMDIYNRPCLVCGKSSSYNYPEEKRGVLCHEHKKEGMISVESVRCEVCKLVTASYGYPMKKKSRCVKHKLPDMVRNYKSCKQCDTQAYYGLKEGNPEYCAKHKLCGMFDVVKKKCDCGIIASYGRLFSKKIHCAKHKKDNEFFKNNPMCQTGCGERAYYVDNNSNYPKRCETCKLPGDKNIVEKPCASCGLPEFLNQDNSLCSMCFSYSTQVNKPERKELVIKKFLEKNNIAIETHDTIIDGACSRKRPDFILDYGLFKVCLEIDEHQHKSYPEECELSRMGAIHQDLGGIDVLFIRFNPDSYKQEGKTIREYKSREKFLLDYLTNLNNVQRLVCPLLVTYFYYDNFSKPEYIYYDYYTKNSEEVEFPFHKIN